jgi:large subunit ribosomal protein L15
MKYNELNITSAKSPKRVGRGISAGQGKTAGRGTKGQKARTGKKLRAGFAGGQNPLMQQLPKLPGFRSMRTAFETVYTGQLDDLKAKIVTTETLAEAGIISHAYVNVKLISKGEVKTAIAVKLPAASQTAIANVQQAGGSFEKTARLQRPQTSTKKADKQAK